MLEAIGLIAVTDADESQQTKLTQALNAALDELSVFAPAKWYGADEASDVLPAPSNVAITTTQNSKDFTSSDITTGAATMMGQAIVIEGDGITNRLVRTSATGKELLVPYLATGGSKSAVIYYDTIQMPSNFRSFKGVLRVVGGDFIRIVDNAQDMGSDPLASIVTGVPTTARMNVRTDTNGYRSTFLRFNALPTTAIRVHYEYYRRPASVATLNDDRNDLVPKDYIQSILIPICLQKLSSITDAVVIDQAKIFANRDAALAILSQAVDQEPYISSVSFSNSVFRP